MKLDGKDQGKTLAIFFSSGGLGDVGRHAILVALDDPRVASIKLFASSKNIKTLDLPNWKCGCTEPHDWNESVTKSSKLFEKFELDLSDKNDKDVGQILKEQLKDVDAVVSCMGNRQPFWGDRVGAAATHHIKIAMEATNVKRIVAMTSMGLNEDYPCMEWRWEGKIMDFLFKTLCRKEKKDLVKLESLLTSSKPELLDYLLVRPVGLGEEAVPEGTYFLQKQKHTDVVGSNMAKMDCARLFVDEAVNPTMHRTAVVVGANPEGESVEEKALEKKKWCSA